MAARASLPARRGARGLGDPARAVGRRWANGCPTTRWRNCARRCSRRIRICSASARSQPGDAGRHRQACDARRHAGQGAVRVADRGLLPDQSDRAGVGGDGRMLGARGRTAPHGRRRSRAMAGILDRLRLAADRDASRRALLLLVILLIAVAYILYADRKIWAAVQIRRGPNVVGPWGLLQSFADLLKFVVKEPVIPAGANKGVFLLAPLVTCVLALAAWAVIPVNAGLGDRRHQCRHPLHLRDLLARRLRHHHGRLGVELEISVPGGAALGGADGVLRGLDRLRDHHRAAVRRLAESVRDRRGAGHAATACSTGTGCRCCRCS